MKWETRFTRFNPIIGIDFSRWKNGQLGKKILFNVLQVWCFPLYNYQQTSYIDPTEYYVISCDVHRYGYVPENNESDKIRTGNSMDRLASLILFHQHGDHAFVLLSRKFKFLGCYTNNSIRYVGPAEIFPSFLSCCDLETECLSILWKK